MLRERRALVVSIIELAVIGAAVLWFTVPRHHASSGRVVSAAPTAPSVETATKAPVRLQPPPQQVQASPRRPKARPVYQRTAHAPTLPTAVPVHPRVAAPPKRKTAPKKAPAPGPIRLVAARGDCWLSIHRATQNGRVLYEGTLVKGRALTYDEPRIWVRFGGASNMTVSVNGKPVRALFGTIDALVDRSGIHAP
jgi:uncharacterized protein DUF4115